MEDIQNISEFAIELANEAAKIAKKYFRKKIDAESKADASLVTVADKEIEDAIVSLIQQKYPDHEIYGEENGGTISDTKPTWVIDPIDGTSSFVSGRPIFGTMIAYLENGISKVGIISQPITGELWLGCAEKQTTLNGSVIITSAKSHTKEAIIATTSTFLFPGDDLSVFDHVRKVCKQTIQGGDCYSYAMLATGFIDIVLESGLKAHDFLPLIPIIEGAGGIITDWHGSPLTHKSKGHVVASANKSLHKEVLSIICSPINDF